MALTTMACRWLPNDYCQPHLIPRTPGLYNLWPIWTYTWIFKRSLKWLRPTENSWKCSPNLPPLLHSSFPPQWTVPHPHNCLSQNPGAVLDFVCSFTACISSGNKLYWYYFHNLSQMHPLLSNYIANDLPPSRNISCFITTLTPSSVIHDSSRVSF